MRCWSLELDDRYEADNPDCIGQDWQCHECSNQSDCDNYCQYNKQYFENVEKTDIYCNQDCDFFEDCTTKENM